jgi:twitching motility two-component system response regulator PilH
MANATILVVEDSATERQVVTTALQRNGYRVLTADNGEEALAQAVDQLPDLIVLDIVLPRMNGFQVCRTLKNNKDTEDIKILMMSSKSQDSDRFWGLKQGADDYLTKPFVEAELLDAIQALL